LKGLTIYFKKPLIVEQTLLAYEPDHNAARPTTKPYSLIEKAKVSLNPANPAHQTAYGRLWRTCAGFSSERQEEEREKALDKRKNLRKEGPSPAAN
jgi:hypothetical protein